MCQSPAYFPVFRPQKWQKDRCISDFLADLPPPPAREPHKKRGEKKAPELPIGARFAFGGPLARKPLSASEAALWPICPPRARAPQKARIANRGAFCFRGPSCEKTALGERSRECFLSYMKGFSAHTKCFLAHTKCFFGHAIQKRRQKKTHQNCHLEPLARKRPPAAQSSIYSLV